jgi:hypothetical protein
LLAHNVWQKHAAQFAAVKQPILLATNRVERILYFDRLSFAFSIDVSVVLLPVKRRFPSSH